MRLRKGSCKSLESRVSALVDGELAAAERGQAEEHVARCEDCASAASAFRELRLRAAGREVPPVTPGEWTLLRERLARRIETRKLPRILPGGSGVRSRRWALAAVAAAVLIGLAAVLLLPGGTEPPLESYAEWRSGPEAEFEMDDEALYIEYKDF